LKYKLYEWDNEVIDEQSKENPYKQPDTQIDFNELDESIRWVQQALINSGYPISVTGIPDAVTQGAILDFQKKRGLKVDGIVGNNTISALLKASKE
jgi:peptidoglycan hydrolase-like protein with peptidoglycan-binding domain